jgi:hypothetical protein
MPPSVSALSRKQIESIRLLPEELLSYPHPVYVDTEQVTGFFKADRLRELIAQREDLSYMNKTVLNEEREGVPGFTFERIQQGEQTLGDFLKSLPREDTAKAPGGTGQAC